MKVEVDGVLLPVGLLQLAPGLPGGTTPNSSCESRGGLEFFEGGRLPLACRWSSLDAVTLPLSLLRACSGFLLRDRCTAVCLRMGCSGNLRLGTALHGPEHSFQRPPSRDMRHADDALLLPHPGFRGRRSTRC
eukprot:86236-Prorocentrum_minimum.AAC.2